MFDFIVKSSVHDYDVKFVENVDNVLKNEIINMRILVSLRHNRLRVTTVDYYNLANKPETV